MLISCAIHKTTDFTMKAELLKILLVCFAVFLFSVTSSATAYEDTALKRTRRNAGTESPEDENVSSCPTIQMMRGRDGRDGMPGRDGRDGEKGEGGEKGETGDTGMQGETGPPGPRSGGVIYTRWGRTTCPNAPGTELLYAGRAGGTHHLHNGGAANRICMPENPDYLNYQPGNQGYSILFGIEYYTPSQPLAAFHNLNVPCAVCYVSTRVVSVMIPAKTVCPPSWTCEYAGYLMSERAAHPSHKGRSMFDCVDRAPEYIPGSQSGQHDAFFFHVEASCDGMPCPPYDSTKELTCVVCTK